MGLNYTDGCVNFRDAGEFINMMIEKPIFQEGKLFRGGSIDHVKEHHEIAAVRSIISLRNGPDYQSFEADYYHFPMSNKVEKYDTSQKEVRVWLNQILSTFENPELRWPILIHCLSGKDRTGIVIAAILMVLGIDESHIEEEYLLSEGEVKTELIQMAMENMRNSKKFFTRVNLDMVRKHLRAALLV
ncbi:MAG: tyrosine-protein phosphatase [Cytophagales bacterium]|nr:tyrosine-protein phosphatase [Cytophagales bacterium]